MQYLQIYTLYSSIFHSKLTVTIKICIKSSLTSLLEISNRDAQVAKIVKG